MLKTSIYLSFLRMCSMRKIKRNLSSVCLYFYFYIYFIYWSLEERKREMLLIFNNYENLKRFKMTGNSFLQFTRLRHLLCVKTSILEKKEPSLGNDHYLAFNVPEGSRALYLLLCLRKRRSVPTHRESDFYRRGSLRVKPIKMERGRFAFTCYIPPFL